MDPAIAVLLVLTVLGILGAFGRPAPAQVMVNPIEYEHRVTTIETQVAAIAVAVSGLSAQLNDLKNMKWLEMLALSGLLGETGIRTLKNRRKRDDE